jgi:hypothetical protein
VAGIQLRPSPNPACHRTGSSLASNALFLESDITSPRGKPTPQIAPVGEIENLVTKPTRPNSSELQVSQKPTSGQPNFRFAVNREDLWFALGLRPALTARCLLACPTRFFSPTGHRPHSNAGPDPRGSHRRSRGGNHIARIAWFCRPLNVVATTSSAYRR